jgi:hypothetical protein
MNLEDTDENKTADFNTREHYDFTDADHVMRIANVTSPMSLGHG